MRALCKQLALTLLIVGCHAQSQKKPGSSGNSSAAFVCGRPLAPCGLAVPAGVTCPKGPGWCQPGHYCGTEKNFLEAPSCLPLPKDCGAAGKPCCPTNTDSPHAGMEDKLKRQPFCKDGSTCFFVGLTAGANNGDPYAGNTGSCTAVAPGCGAGPGAPCCPIPNHMASNPPLKQVGCAGAPDAYCAFGPAPAPGQRSTSVCRANACDCGAIGKACCVLSGMYGNARMCGAAKPAGLGAPLPAVGGGLAVKSFCAGGGDGGAGGSVPGLCTVCPSAGVTPADVEKRPELSPCAY